MIKKLNPYIDLRTIKLFLWSAFCISILLSTLMLIFINKDYLSVAGDFISYYVGGSIIARGMGADIYNLSLQYSQQLKITGAGVSDWVLPFRGLPIVALLYVPLTFISFTNSYVVFVILNVIVLLFIIFLLFKQMESTRKTPQFFLIPFLFIPILQTLWMGQLSIILCLILLTIYIFLKTEKSFWVGFFTSFVLIKAQYLLVIPFIFLIEKNKKEFVKGLSFSLAFIIIISIFVSGVRALLTYPTFLQITETPEFGSRINEVLSLNAAIHAFLPTNSKTLSLIVSGVLYLILLALYFFRRKIIGFEKSYIVTVLLALVFPIHILPFDYSLLIIPIFILIESYLKERRNSRKFYLIYIVLLLFVPLLGYFTVRHVVPLFLLLSSLHLLLENRPENIRYLDSNNE